MAASLGLRPVAHNRLSSKPYALRLRFTLSLYAFALRLPGPEHALVAARHRADAFVDELLHALTLVGLGRVDVALGVRSKAVHAVELARLTSAGAEGSDLFQRLTHDDAHARVLAVCHQDEALLRILGEHDVPGRSRPERVAGEEPFLDELAFRGEDLQTIVLPVADIDEAVVRTLDAVHRIAELLRGRRLGIVRAKGGVVRLVAVGAPIALHLAGVGIDHRDALVAVAVRDIGLVGLGIDPDLGDAAEVLRIIAALA